MDVFFNMLKIQLICNKKDAIKSIFSAIKIILSERRCSVRLKTVEEKADYVSNLKNEATASPLLNYFQLLHMLLYFVVFGKQATFGHSQQQPLIHL